MNRYKKLAAWLITVAAAGVLWMSGCAKQPPEAITAEEAERETPSGEETKQEEKSMEVTIDAVTTESFTMEYCKFGSGDKTLVVLPGLSVQSVMPSANAIAEQYKSLCDDYTVYVFDRRKEVPSSYSVKDMADDTVTAVKALNLDHVSIFGASQGGMITMEIAAHDPDLVEKIVLGSTSACIEEDRFGLFEEWISLAKEGKAEELYLSFGEAVYPKETFEGAKDVFKQMAETVTREELDHFVILAESLRGFDIQEDVTKITCPTLVLGSNDDMVVGGDASRKIYEALGNQEESAIHMYDGYGHAVYDLAPDYLTRMGAFLNKE